MVIRPSHNRDISLKLKSAQKRLWIQSLVFNATLGECENTIRNIHKNNKLEASEQAAIMKATNNTSKLQLATLYITVLINMQGAGEPPA